MRLVYLRINSSFIDIIPIYFYYLIVYNKQIKRKSIAFPDFGVMWGNLMEKLILLYWGTVLLMYLSQNVYPVDLNYIARQNGKNNYIWRKSDVYMVIIIVWMTCFSFLRTKYNDTGNYIGGFLSAQSVEEGFANGTFTDWSGNPLSMLYRSVIREITDNYHIYFFFPAFISSFAVVKLCKNFSVNPAFSLVVFYSIGTYVMYIAALKQCLAMFFLLMALPYALEKKYVKFYILTFVAVLFHTHAFMFFIIPLLTRKPWSKVTWIMLGCVLFAMATYKVTLGAFMEYAQSLGAFVAEDEVFDGHQINVIRVLVYWVPAVFSFIFREKLFSDSSKTEDLFANISITSALILTIGLVEGANLYARMAGYFEIATAITLPWMITKLFSKQSVRFVFVIAMALYFGYFFYEFAVVKDFGNNYAAISLREFLANLFN